ncbi:GGDEF domain-containing protein [Sphingomonas sp. IC4-52]|uniref:GGDEF domain-containing protein n=1 Tax=Sphingomonas sp. IC4-52 TaxID=2887202 RepID=UPI001D11B37D|nr:GGDEF domain-containing protein [Sphingomonas sp. IC4-52]MCC2980952.1 GGDEF domain-containing protein [Sphingomonas sp. IC4-52]
MSWLFQPTGTVDPTGRGFLLGELLGSVAAAVMGSFCALIVSGTALLRSGDPSYMVFCALEASLIALRVTEWRWRSARSGQRPDHVPSIDASAVLSALWCTLQGALAFTIMSSGDLVLSVLSATLVTAMLGPICARNYAAPRFAFLLVLLCDLPFVAGAMASSEMWFTPIVALTPLFLVGAMQIIRSFHRTMLMTLAARATALHLAEHDSLTGILNRHGMDRALSRIPPGGERQMALLSIDLDGFKQVNDRYGHGVGDILLTKVADRMKRELRPEDLLGRMGGDEFMVIVRDMRPEHVAPLVDRLIEAIARAPYDVGGLVVHVGASVGFACLPEDAATAVELRLRADDALYAAKGAGKGVGRRYRQPWPDTRSDDSVAGQQFLRR